MNLQDLKKEIPFKWRVQSYSQNKASASCVAYIDARDVMDLLDEVCGAGNWQDDYKMVGDSMIAGIGILIENIWVWKWDIGSESNVEKEKGEMSDSFKRAAVKWGIGRFLYRKKIQYIPTNKPHNKQTEKPYCTCYPVDNGKRIWDITEYINNNTKKSSNTPTEPQKATSQPSKPQTGIKCQGCSKDVSEAEKGYSEMNYNKTLCRTCQGKYKKV